MLDALKDTPCTTGSLCALFPDLDHCTVMQHPGVLEDARLIVTERRDRERWTGPYAAYAAHMLGRLKMSVEEKFKSGQPA